MKPQRNDRYANGYIYIYANDMLKVMPGITPTATPHVVTPSTTPTTMPMTMSMATPIKNFHDGLYMSKNIIGTWGYNNTQKRVSLARQAQLFKG